MVERVDTFVDTAGNIVIRGENGSKWKIGNGIAIFTDAFGNQTISQIHSSAFGKPKTDWIDYCLGYICPHCKAEFSDELAYINHDGSFPKFCPACGREVG